MRYRRAFFVISPIRSQLFVLFIPLVISACHLIANFPDESPANQPDVGSPDADSDVDTDHDSEAEPACHPGNCGGCCNGDRCENGGERDACGRGGLGCNTCPEESLCVEGQCALPCAIDCAGCCQDGACLSGESDEACGYDGQDCEECPADSTCTSRQCIDQDCGMTCDGCCDYDLCIDPPDSLNCGIFGDACAACGEAHICHTGQCFVDENTLWNIHVLSAELPVTTIFGGSWDDEIMETAPPDPYVEMGVFIDGPLVLRQSHIIENSFDPVWNVAIHSDVFADDILGGLSVSIIDSDPVGFDSIGNCVISVAESMFNEVPFLFDCPRDADAEQPCAGWSLTLQFEHSG